MAENPGGTVVSSKRKERVAMTGRTCILNEDRPKSVYDYLRLSVAETLASIAGSSR